MKKQFIEGKFTDSGSEDYIEVINPATGEVIDKIETLPASMVSGLYEIADKSRLAWEVTTLEHRVDVLKKFASNIRKNKEELARLCTAESGKILKDSIAEVNKSADYIDFMCSVAVTNAGNIQQASYNNAEYVARLYKPIGNVLGITAWNAPVLLFMRKVIPSLLAGCSIIIKPSSTTPLTALYLASLTEDIGLTPGILQVIVGRGSEIGDLIVKDPHLDMVTMTGSTKAGKRIMKAASGRVTKVNLELGGKAPVLVSKTADIKKAVKNILTSKCTINGQVCTCPDRVYVVEDVYEKFIEQMSKEIDKITLGNPNDSTTTLGPIHTTNHVEYLDELVENAASLGAKVITNPRKASQTLRSYYPFTLVIDVSQDMRIMREETFGPVLPIMKVSTFEQAIALANDNEFGLSSYVSTESYSEAMSAVNKLNYGEVYVNTIGEEALSGFHSGWRESGIGGADGVQGYREFFANTVGYFNFE